MTMRKFAVGVFALGALLALSGCASADNGNPVSTIDPALIPSAPPANAVQVDPANFDDGFGEWIFKVGEGPTWCTISPAIDGDNSGGNVICEQNEAAALYKPIPIPASCDYSFGYQVRLMGVPGAVEGTDTASFTCASGFYADPSEAPILAAGQRITVAPFKCFVEDVNVRCENETGQFIALGPKVWAVKD